MLTSSQRDRSLAMHHEYLRHSTFFRVASSALLILSLSCRQPPDQGISEASTLKSIKELCEITEISIETVIGGGGNGKSGGLQLFDGDFERADKFEASLVDQVIRRLEDYGMDVAADAPNVLQVAIYGHQVRSAACQSADVHLTKIFLHKESLDLGNENTAPVLGFRIGASEREESEAVLTSSVLDILESARCH